MTSTMSPGWTVTLPFRSVKLRERGYAVGLVADIDIDIGAGDFEYLAFHHFMAGRRREVAVILEQMLIFFRVHTPAR